jgi:hypothetical protein
MRGRFRELLVDTLLAPWLPAYVGCGTGMIVDVNDRKRDSTQDDIVVFDKSLVPPVLASSTVLEGVFPLDGVLARIEVKSTLTKSGLRDAVLAANEVGAMKFAGVGDRTWPLPISLIFAYASDMKADGDAELQRLFEVTDELGLRWSGNYPDLASPISGLCVLGKGCWAAVTAEGVDGWVRTKRTTAGLDEVLVFVGAVSNTCFSNHVVRQGRDPQLSVEGGIGRLFLTFDLYEPVPPGLVPPRPAH